MTALDGVNLVVPPGTLAALLGPNGAGKTTLVRILATLTRPDSGSAAVLGADVVRAPDQVRKLVGLTGQFAGLDDALTGRDNLILIGRLTGMRRRAAAERAAQLAELFGLAGAIQRIVKTYSGGMRRRLDLAASLMAGPALLILDEPTTGLDPSGREQLWAILADLRAAGTTMLLTTQYLEEADRFADQVHVLKAGRIVASGTAATLKAQAGRQVADVRLAEPMAGPAAARAIAARLGIAPDGIHGPEPGRLSITAAESVATLLAVAASLQANGIGIADIGLRQPTLDEAFLALTGQTGVPA